MKIYSINTIVFLIIYIVLFINVIQAQDISNAKGKGAYCTGRYPNLFVELSGKSESQVNEKIENTWKQLFYGDDQTQRLYYPVEPDMAHIKDVLANDVRSEGISYGLMIAVQLNKKEEFNHQWKWAKTFMQHKNGQRKNLFAWQCKPDGSIIDQNSASDGEEWIAMALFFASARWGNGTGIYNYQAEAQVILDAMLNKKDSYDNDTTITNMFNMQEKQVVFSPIGTAAEFTDPSYHVPHFYELWARWADKNNQFWCDAASMSRKFFTKAAHPVTGLMPDYALFDGTPTDPWNGGHANFNFDAWRVAMNIAVDYSWFAGDTSAITLCNKLLNFFYSKGISSYIDQFTLDGKNLSPYRSPGLIAMNAVAALASTNKNRIEFINALWELAIPSGKYRYYNAVLYMLALLQVSGNFKVYHLTGSPVSGCSN